MKFGNSRKCNVWRMVCATALIMISLCGNAQAVEGMWNGQLNLGVSKLTVGLKFTATDGGAMRCVMLSPDQTTQEIPATIDYLTEDSLCVSVGELRVDYRARIAGDKMEGTFTQMGHALPLTLNRGELVYVRLQEPQKPYPYTTTDISIYNPVGGATIAGTLTYPVGYDGSVVPVVVLVSGSGAQNRDEELMHHRPFLVIADYLAHNGIATFRYDDRGVGESTGDVLSVTVQSNTADAFWVVNHIKSLKKFSKVGVMGHSEGGMIAYALGAMPNQLDFVIAEAGPAVKGREVLRRQLIDICKASGMSDSDVEVALIQQDMSLKRNTNKWMESFVDYDPATDISRIGVPTFAFFGEKDLQVNAADNLAALQKAFPTTGVRLEAKIYPGLNHLMQPAESGLMQEYGQIETTISTEVLEDVVVFIKNQIVN